MPDDAAFGMFATGLHHAHREARRTGRNDRVGWCCGVHVSEQLNLEIFPLGAVFLHEVRVAQRLLQVGSKAKPLP